MKKTLTMSLALLLALACSDEGEEQQDLGVTQKDGTILKKDTTAPKKDLATPKKDLATPKKDLATPKKDLATPTKDGTPPIKDQATPIKDQATPKPDQPPPPPDQALPDLVPPKPDAALFSCPPLGLKQLVLKGNGTGDWAVALEPKTSYKNIGLPASAAKYGVGTADYNVNWQQVAGFVLSKPSTATTVATEATAALTNLGKNLYGTIATKSSGSATKSHDGYDMVEQTEVTITTASTSDVSTVRNLVLAALINKTSITLTGLPGIFGVPDTSFIIRFSTLLRADGRVIHIGAVTDAKGDADLSKVTGIISRDLASATGLARVSKKVGPVCDTIAVGKSANKVDFIWVMDESGSMTPKRTDIANNANLLWKEAQTVGLDFRMAVTNVVNPTGSYANCVGRFCTQISTDPYDTKGTDRFLMPTEQKIFEACIKNPPCFEGGSEYGLVNAKKAVELHIPRAANTPTKIRTGAQVVIVVVTDEIPNSLNGTIPGNELKTCPLKTATQTKLDAALKTTYMDYFAGLTTKDAKINYFQVIGGICKNSCNIQVAHGYKEVAAKFNGTTFDLCQKSLATDLKKLVQQIVLSGSPLKLTKAPIVASIQVAMNNAAVARSKLNGYDYVASANSLMLYGSASPKVGTNVVISYQNWQ